MGTASLRGAVDRRFAASCPQPGVPFEITTKNMFVRNLDASHLVLDSRHASSDRHRGLGRLDCEPARRYLVQGFFGAWARRGCPHHAVSDARRANPHHRTSSPRHLLETAPTRSRPVRVDAEHSCCCGGCPRGFGLVGLVSACGFEVEHAVSDPTFCCCSCSWDQATLDAP